MSNQEGTHEKTGLVFISGAGLNSCVWSEVAKRLDHPYLLVDYPQRNDLLQSRKKLSLDDYVVHLKRQVDEWGSRKFVIVAHSLGGVLGLRLSSEIGGRLSGFVAVGAAIPQNGGSFLSVLPFPKRILLSALLRIIGTKPPESAIRSGLCNDLSAEQAIKIVDGFVPEAVRLYTDRIGVSLPIVPKLYVKLTQDKEFIPSLQERMISNLSPQSVQALNTGHLPMLSDPEGVGAILNDFMANTRQ